MSLGVSGKRLGEAKSALDRSWRSVRERWDDSASDKFREEFLDELDPAVRSAMSGLGRMAEVIARARSECS